MLSIASRIALPNVTSTLHLAKRSNFWLLVTIHSIASKPISRLANLLQISYFPYHLPIPATAAQVKFTSNTNGTYDLAFKDITLKVEALDNVKVQGGTSMQSKLEGQVIDLRGYLGGSAIVDTKTIGDAVYNDFIAFYAVEDDRGTLANGLKPGDVGYAQAAIESAVLGTRFKSQVDTEHAR